MAIKEFLALNCAIHMVMLARFLPPQTVQAAQFSFAFSTLLAALVWCILDLFEKIPRFGRLFKSTFVKLIIICLAQSLFAPFTYGILEMEYTFSTWSRFGAFVLRRVQFNWMDWFRLVVARDQDRRQSVRA